MIIQYSDNSPEGQERERIISQLLPEKTLIETLLKPKLSLLNPTLIKMLYAELEIYKAFPKKPLDNLDKAKKELKTFDPRNNTTCFQGKAFRGNDDLIDSDLHRYRKAVGTFNHAEWGNATLLEIWGGDHFAAYPDMVKAAFKYGSGIIKKRPVLTFYVNPLFINEKSGRVKLTPEQKKYKEDMDLLLAQAMAFGVKGPKSRRNQR